MQRQLKSNWTHIENCIFCCQEAGGAGVFEFIFLFVPKGTKISIQSDITDNIEANILEYI